MPCDCGDTYCSSCGPAQGNSRCPWCGAWEADGGCQRPDWCAEREQQEREQREREETVDYFYWSWLD